MPPRPNVRELGLKLTYMEKTSKEDDECLPDVTDIPQLVYIRDVACPIAIAVALAFFLFLPSGLA